MKKSRFVFLLVVFSLFFELSTFAQPAFPGAEGYGAASVGGRGGVVIKVTNLNDSGTGSLRAACEATGARTVVFTVSGTIVTNGIAITNPFITIAGQTAPGGGICLKLSTTPSGAAEYDCMAIMTHDVIVRNIRFRAGTGSGIPGQPATYTASSQVDAFGCYNSSNVIIDHCSMSWGTDGSFDMWFSNSYITVQNCIISETLNNSTHSTGPHSYGFLLGSDDPGAGCVNYLSIHHNLISNNDERSPRVEGNQFLQVTNNVIYNWGVATSIISTGQSLTKTQTAKADYVSNYYKAGPNKVSGVDYGVNIGSTSGAKVYVSGNISPSRTLLTNPEWNFVSGSATSFQVTTPWCTSITYPVTVTAYPTFVSPTLANVGATIPRDVVDTRIVNDAINGTGTLIDNPMQVGGWPILASGTAPADTDNDGMSDSWETAHGLNPNNAADLNGTSVSAPYTNLEAYLNSLFNTTNIPVTGITVNPATTSISAGSTKQLTATIAPSNATNTTVAWTSNTPSVATVNSTTGLVTAVTTGTATITGTTTDGGFTNNCVVTVTAATAGNMLQNPSFESALTVGWTENWGNSVQNTTTTYIRTGTKSLKVGVGSGGMAQWITTGNFTIGGTYTLSAWCGLSKSSTVQTYIGVDFYNSAGTQLTEIDGSMITNFGSLAQKTLTFTVPANTNYFRVFIYYTGKSGTYVYADDFGLTPGTVALKSAETAPEIIVQKPENLVSIYPNPSSGLVTVNVGNSNESVIKVYSVTGKLLLQQKTCNNTETIDLSSFKGLLLMKIENDHQEYIRKIIIK